MLPLVESTTATATTAPISIAARSPLHRSPSAARFSSAAQRGRRYDDATAAMSSNGNGNANAASSVVDLTTWLAGRGRAGCMQEVCALGVGGNAREARGGAQTAH